MNLIDSRYVINSLAETNKKLFKGIKPVFDGQKNLFTAHRLPGIGKDAVDFTVMYQSIMVIVSLGSKNPPNFF